MQKSELEFYPFENKDFNKDETNFKNFVSSNGPVLVYLTTYLIVENNCPLKSIKKQELNKC